MNRMSLPPDHPDHPLERMELELVYAMGATPPGETRDVLNELNQHFIDAAEKLAKLRGK